MCSGDPWPHGARNSVTETRPAVASLEALTVASAPRNQSASPAPGWMAIDVTAGWAWVLICCLLWLGCGPRRRRSRSLDQMGRLAPIGGRDIRQVRRLLARAWEVRLRSWVPWARLRSLDARASWRRSKTG